MHRKDDQEFYREREQAERAAAAAAKDPAAKSAHRKMAEHYARMLAEMSAEQGQQESFPVSNAPTIGGSHAA